MTFFNKKEEVIDIELTQYGKFKLSRGKFKPEYYAFFDDDILYDIKYAEPNTTEDQNDIKTRIRETIRPKTQHLHYSVEEERRNTGLIADVDALMGDLRDQRAPLEELNTLLARVEQDQQVIYDKFYSLTCPIGTAEIGNQEQPIFDVSLVASEFSSSVSYNTLGANQIPKVTIEPRFKIEVEVAPENENFFQSEENIILGTFDTPGDTVASAILRREEVIILFEEKNSGPSLMDNFDIEVFIKNGVEEDDKYRQLYFAEDDEIEFVKNGILVNVETGEEEDSDIIGVTPESVVTDPNAVEFYIDMTYDTEIDAEIMCRHLVQDKVTDPYTEVRFNCEEIRRGNPRPNIYRPEDYEDPCDDQ